MIDEKAIGGRVRFGQIYADRIGFEEAIERIVARAAARQGGYVVTPNVDHIVIAESDPELVSAYKGAFLSLADGAPLLWFARLFGRPLPAKVSGSDLTVPLVRAAAGAGVGVFFLGATPETCAVATAVLEAECEGLRIVGHLSPAFSPAGDQSGAIAACEAACESGAGLVLVAMGAPKQEALMSRYVDRMGGAVAIGVGGTLRFIAGEVDRCPSWISRIGFEWLYRLVKEPRRLAHRYLVRDRAIFGIVWRQWRQGRHLAVPGDGRVGG